MKIKPTDTGYTNLIDVKHRDSECRASFWQCVLYSVGNQNCTKTIDNYDSGRVSCSSSVFPSVLRCSQKDLNDMFRD